MSTNWYAKLDAGFHANRKARKAGRLGRELFVFVLCQNAQRGMTGSIPADDLEPWHVAEQLQMTEAEVTDAIKRAVDAGLIAVGKERVTIKGWNEEWGKRPRTNAERQQKRRDKVKNGYGGHETNVTSHETNVTSHSQGDASRRKEGTKGSRKEGRDREQRATARRLSPDFAASAEALQIAGERGLNLGHELAQFRDHCSSVGKTSKDWDAEFRKWLRGSDGRGAPKTADATTPSSVAPTVFYQRTTLNPSHFHEVVDGEVKRLVEKAPDGAWQEVER